MNAFDMSPRDFQLYLDERGYTGDQRDDLLRRYRRANSPFAGIFDFIEGLRGGDEEAGLRRGEIAPMVFPEGMSGFEAFTTGQARPAVPGFLLGGAEAAASAVDAPSAAAAGLIPAQDAAMEALGTAGFAMGAGGAAVRPAGSVGMGGRVADALPDPRNEAEAMAKQVLEMRAAGRAGDVTEEMMAAADPQYMFAHTPLPMDEASRMARAAASGRNPEFHGTTTGSDMTYADAFRGSGSRRGIGFVTSDNPYVASSYADPEFGAVFPLLNAPLPPEAPRIDVGGNVWSDISVETPVRLGDRVIAARQLSAEPADAGGVLSTNQLSRGASFDYPGIEFSNILDRSIHAPRPRTDDGMEIMKRFQRLASEPSTVTMRQDTRGVRSRFARFDPEFAHLRNLSAANADKSTGLLAAAAAETPTGIRAYHGSPHDFDRFSMDAIGTGEGAQAYGHGLYFAEAEPVARGYRDMLSSRAAPGDAQGNAYDLVQRMGGDEEWTAETLRDAIKNVVSPNTKQFLEDTLKHVENKTYADYAPPNGRMYEVNIDANPEAFLDWDKPLRDQPKIAGIMGYADPDEIAAAKRSAYAEFSAPTGDTFEDLFAPLSPAEQAAAERLSTMPAPWGNMTGKDAYYALQSQGFREGAVGANLPQPNPMKKADKWASEWLRDQGVPGIKYLDAMSRNAGEGSRNYVVFDENLINIVRKYGIAGAAAVLGVSVADVEAAMAQAQPAPRTPGLLVQ